MRFEVITLGLGTFILVLTSTNWIPGLEITDYWIECLFALRGIRTVRLLNFMTNYRTMLLIMYNLYGLFVDMVTNLFMIFYVYAVIGIGIHERTNIF